MATTNVWNGNWFSNQKKVADAIQNFDSDGNETKTIIIPACTGAASSADWTNTAGYAALPASKSAKDFVIPITGLKVGDVIKSYTVYGQIEATSGTVTLDASMYRQVTDITGTTQTDIGAITQVNANGSVDVAVASSKTLATEETVATNESFIVALTGTTAASTDIQVAAVEVTIN